MKNLLCALLAISLATVQVPATGASTSRQTPAESREKPATARAHEALLPGTWLRIRLEVEGFRPASLEAPAIRQRFADRAVLVGRIGPGDSMLALTLEKRGYEGDGSELCDELLRADPRGGESFSARGFACLERVQELEGGIREARWDAFLVLTSGRVLQLTSSTVLQGEGPQFTRERFEACLAGLHAAWLRRGSFDDYPPELLAVFDELCLHGDRAQKRIEEARRRAAALRDGEKPDGRAPAWPEAFAFGELCAPDAAARRTYFEIARAELGSLTSAPPAAVSEVRAAPEKTKHKWALAMCEESLGVLDLEAGDPRAALACFLRAAEQASTQRAELRAGIGYNQACAHALLGEEEAALEALEKAIELEPRYRELARDDADFASLRGERRYQELVSRAK